MALRHHKVGCERVNARPCAKTICPQSDRGQDTYPLLAQRLRGTAEGNEYPVPYSVALLNDRRLDRSDFLRIRLAVFRLAVAVDVGTRMDRDVLVNDIAGHVRGAREDHFLGFDLAIDG